MSNGEIVPKEEGRMMIQNFIITHPSAIKGHLFDKEHILNLLNSPGTEGMRTYYGYENGSPCLVLVATDAQGNDLENNPVIERGSPCPPYCSGNGYFINGPAT